LFTPRCRLKQNNYTEFIFLCLTKFDKGFIRWLSLFNQVMNSLLLLYFFLCKAILYEDFIKWQHLVIWFELLSTRISKFNNSLVAWLPGKQAEQVRRIHLILYSQHSFAHSFRKGQIHHYFVHTFTPKIATNLTQN